MPSKLGRRVVDLCYRYSPAAVEFMRDRVGLKTIAGFTLVPVAVAVEFWLTSTVDQKLLVLTLLVFVPMFLMRTTRRRAVLVAHSMAAVVIGVYLRGS